MALEKPITGKGFGSFEAGYGNVQANYFLTNTTTVNEKNVADYVIYSYNEFLEIFIESGVIGLLLFISILYFAFIKRYDKKSSKYHIAAKSSLIALLILSMVTNPFKSISNILLLIICLFIIFRTGNYKAIPISKHYKAVVFLWLFSISYLVYDNSKHIYGKYYFKKGYAKIVNNDLVNGILDYEKAYPFIESNGKFLFHYGSALNLNNNYIESVKFLQKAVTLRSDPNAFIILGKSLKKLKRYNEAEKVYQIASNITPSKLYPKYLLAKLYLEMQEYIKAKDMAKIIIKSKEKIITKAGKEIKAEMKLLITKTY